MALIILAGGRGTRLGRAKSRLALAGKPVIATLIAQLRFAGEALIAASDPTEFAALPARVVPDPPAGTGPLAGIAAGLAASNDAYNLVVACDMPFPSPALGRDLLLELARGVDVAVPCPGGFPEPTFAAYARACLPAIERRLAAGEFKVTGFYDDVRTLRIPDAQLARFGPSELTFLNINTPADLARAEALLPAARALGHWPK